MSFTHNPTLQLHVSALLQAVGIAPHTIGCHYLRDALLYTHENKSALFAVTKDLYPEIDIETHWHENVLNAMKVDKRFCMEMDEPMCKNKLPREGIVLRINDDPMAEAFKLKCLKFLGKEAEDNDKGKTSDIEMQERYAGDSSEEN